MRDERHLERVRLPTGRGLQSYHILNFVDPDTGAHIQRIENTRWGIKRSMPRTGISKDLFGSYVQEWLWRKQYGEDPFENIIEHIAEVYDVRKTS